MSHVEITDPKDTQACMRSAQFDHSYSDHYHDGALKSHPRSHDRPVHNGHGKSRQADNHPIHQHLHDITDHSCAVSFNKAHTNSAPSTDADPNLPTNGPVSYDSTLPGASPASTEPTARGLMIDTGAPYLEIGFLDVSTLTSSINPTWTVKLDPLPAQFAAVHYGSMALVNTPLLHVKLSALSCYIPSLLQVARYTFRTLYWKGHANGFLAET